MTLLDEWWAFCSESQLMQRACDQCEGRTFTLRRYCTDCFEEMSWTEAGDTGVVVTFSDVVASSVTSALGNAPYVVAYVDVGKARLLTNLIASPASVRIGEVVRLVFRRSVTPPHRTVPLFQPVNGGSS